MKINQLLMAVLNNTQVIKEKRIRDMYSEMQKCISELEQNNNEEKSATEKVYLKAFMSVMQRMGDELAQARNKYESLDKEKFKIQKCEKLAEDIKVFREECYSLRHRLNQVNQGIRMEKIKLDIISHQQEGLKMSLMKAKEKKRKNKQSYRKLKSMKEESRDDQCKQEDQIQSGRINRLGGIFKNGNQTERKLTGPSQEVKDMIRKRPSSTNHTYRRQDYF